MSLRSVLVFGPELGVASSMSALTSVELVQYILGYFEFLHKTLPVHYPDGKAQFVVHILCDGYHECTKVSSWTDIAEVQRIDLDELEPTPGDKLDHKSFHDDHAYRLIIKKFAANLGG